MTPTTETMTTLLRQAAIRAIRAPSVHNTQPWLFVLNGDALELHADKTRQLKVLDPSTRQLLISCGCALFNARVALAAKGYDALVERFPDPKNPDLLARIRVPDAPSDWLPLGTLDEYIDRRQTNRRRFEDEVVAAETVYELVHAANAEDSELFVIKDSDHQLATARLSQQADAIQNTDPAYRAELRAWTTDDPQRRDGVPAMAVPHVDAGAGDDVPIRDFDTHGMGWLPTNTQSSMHQCLLLLGTRSDNPESWLRAGEALERIWLEATRHNYVASPLTQVVEIPRTRTMLRAELNLPMYPHVLLRVGHAAQTPASRRRRLSDVIAEAPARD
jgi:nitroreductase